ncbi:AI-2E family transporter [Curtobacterium sp. MCBD17_040]|uniref:AI-2E family transporter n=1 Tax=Curtobacterium sp. MCBD17_040 TaxID=2175674 RepID=UPI0021AC5D9A|nr:AI-2E family transporter [Curtobacterium sp. MCBD17_040]WIB62920.1 AI-2E family transporter [Curtobacterium sp. MCBD17_040]
MAWGKKKQPDVRTTRPAPALSRPAGREQARTGREQVPSRRHPASVVEDNVPVGMQIAGAFSWRILVVVGVIALFIWLMTLFSEILIPFLVGIVIAAFLIPISNWMQRHHVPKWAAIVISLIGGLAAVAALLWLVVSQIVSSYPSLKKQTLSQFDNIKDLIAGAGLGVTQKDISGYLDQGTNWLQAHSSSILSGVASAGSSLTHVAEGLFVILFTVIFLLIDGKNVWRWSVRVFPIKARAAVDGAGVAGWITLSSFVRVQIFVAFADAVGIGFGSWFVGLFFGGLPLVIPIAVFVFLGAFVPVVGAIVTGFLAVFVALIFNGPVAALLVIGVVLLVQQIEGHILQPLVMGNAVKVHPLAVVLGVTAFSGLAGIAGAFFAVPLIAVLNSMVTTVAQGRWKYMDSDHVRDAKPEHGTTVIPRSRWHRHKIGDDVPAPGSDKQPTANKGTAVDVE